MSLLYEVSRPLSGFDILKGVDMRPNIIKYSDIHNYYDLDDVLGDNKMCVLLYLTKKDFGHWCCVYENDKGHIIFFDSYGFVPDKQLSFIPCELKKELNQEHKILTKMLYDSHKPVEYNQYRLQELTPNVSTCGRWVIIRLLYKNISIDDFAKCFFNKKLSPDVIVTLLTD